MDADSMRVDAIALNGDSLSTISQPIRVDVSRAVSKLSFAPIVSEDVMVHIVDVLGRTILQRDVRPGGRYLSISERNLSNGDYFAVLMDGGHHSTAKFHVEK